MSIKVWNIILQQNKEIHEVMTGSVNQERGRSVFLQNHYVNSVMGSAHIIRFLPFKK